MNNLEDYIKSLLIEDDCNVAMNNILNKYFEDNEAPQAASEIVENGTYYIMDPFPFLLFDRNGNLSQKMVTYCKAVLADYDAHKNEYRHLCFLPPYIKDVPQLTIFSTITRNYILGGLIKKHVGGHEVVESFYKLLNDSKVDRSQGDDYVFTKFKSWNILRNNVQSSSQLRIAVPRDIGEGQGYGTINSSKNHNVFCVSNVSMNYETAIVPIMNLVKDLAKDFNIKKNSLSSEKPKNETEIELYLSYLIANCSLDVEAVERSINNVVTRTPGKVKSEKINGRSNSFDKDTYKNTRLTPQDNNIEYWKDTMIGDAIQDLNQNAGGNSEAWKKVVDDMSHTFDRKKLDNDIEKFYNAKHFIPDVLGLETDDTRYDARKYEDPNRRKIKGVSGYDIFKHDKEIQKLEDEIEDLKQEIAAENDEKKIEKLQKKIQDNEDEIDIIKQALDSKEAQGERTNKKYKDKVSNTDNGTSITSSDLIKANNYVTSKGNAKIQAVLTYIDRA